MVNKEAIIKITEPEVVSKTEPIENGATGVIIYNYDKSHVYYKGIDLGSFEELLNLKKYITDLQKKAELGEHYKHLYSELKKQKDEIFKYIKSFEYYIPEDNKNELLRMLGEIDVED